MTGLADDWDNGTPGLVIGGDGVYEVEAGETTRLIIQLKNTGAGTAENVNVQAKGAAGIIPYKLSLAGGGNVGVVFMVGPSGSGKSTVIKLLIGEVEPSEGRVMTVDLPLPEGPTIKTNSPS